MRVSLNVTLIVALLVPAALAAQARRAPRWQEIGKTSQGNAVFVDPRSVRRDAGIVTATVRAVFTPPVKTPRGDLRSSRTIAMFDCAARKFAVKENLLFHDEVKGTVFERRAPKVPGYGSAFKGTLPEIAMNHLCKP